MRVEAERDECIGAGQCVLAAPGLFDQDDTAGLVVVLTREVPPSMIDAAREAADSCPAQAIRLHGESERSDDG